MKKKVALAIAIIVVVVLGIIIHMGQQPPASNATHETQIVKFGANLPETGNLAQLGVPKREAFLLAAEQINEHGGISGRRVEIVIGDNKGDPRTGIDVLRKLHSIDGINLFYVDITRVANACVAVADQEKVIMFAGSAHPAITEGSPWVFRVFTSGDQETQMIADYLKKHNVKSIYILHSHDVLGESSRNYLTRRFENTGGKVRGADAFDVGQQDCRQILIKARDSGAEKIVLIGYGVTFPALLQQSYGLGIKNTAVVGNIGFVGPGVASLSPALTEDIIFTGPSYAYKYQAPVTPQMKAFVEGYKAKYGKVPDYTAAFAYDTVMILKKVIEDAGTDPERIRAALLKVRDYGGVSGRITFKSNGDTSTDTSLMVYKDGKVAPLKE